MKMKSLYTLRLYVRAADSNLAVNVLDQAAAICEQHDVSVEAKEITVPSERTVSYFDARARKSNFVFTIMLVVAGLFFLGGLWMGTAKAADEYAIGTILKSDHYLPCSKDCTDYNEDHWPSLYGSWRYGMHTHAVGTYLNSEDDQSAFYLYGQRTNRYFSVFIGGATGYDETPLMPMVGVKINLGPVTIMPAFGVIAYGLEYRWQPDA